MSAPAPARAPVPAPAPGNGAQAPQAAPAHTAAPAATPPTDPIAPTVHSEAAIYEARIAALESVISTFRNTEGGAWTGAGSIAALDVPASKESPRKVVLPPIVAGFKANALDNGA